MNKFINILEKYLMPVAGKISANKYMGALRDGFVYTLPFTMVGSIFLLIAAFPVPAVSTFLNESGIAGLMYMVTGVTFDMLAIMAVLGIAYHLAKSNDDDGFVVAVLALLTFLMLLPHQVVAPESGEVVSGAISKEFMGGKGVFTAIFVGLLVPTIFNKFSKFVIKMPAGVPPSVAKSFAAVIPVAFVIVIFWLFQCFFLRVSDYDSISQLLYVVLQVPMQALGDTLWGLISILFITNLLWFFGIHGSTVVMGIVGPIFQANSLANYELYQAGQLTLDNGAYIVTSNMFDQFINNGGSGMLLGVSFLMAFRFFKSKQLQTIGKLAVVPGIFTINEPVLFGLPVILNPMLLIPFILAPIAAGLITYFAIFFEIMPPMNGIMIPWTTPPILSGLLVAGPMGALVQVVNLVVATLIWLPFLKVVDKSCLRDEAANEQA